MAPFVGHAGALTSAEHDVLLIHTHVALRAEQTAKFRLLALSEDRKDSTVNLFVKPDHTACELGSLLGGQIGSPGLQSWATATARATIRGLHAAAEPQFRTTRFQDAVPLMVELNTVSCGISRSRRRKRHDQHGNPSGRYPTRSSR